MTDIFYDNDKIKKYGNLLFVSRTGSHLYGLNDENSDEDIYGVFVAKESYYYGLQNIQKLDLSIKSKTESGKNTPDAVDYILKELREFTRLCITCNPNTIEILFTDDKNILYENEKFKNYRIFLSENCLDKNKISNSFMGFITSQKKKGFNKIDRFKELEKLKCVYSNEILNQSKNMTIQEFLKENSKLQSYLKLNNDNVRFDNLLSFHLNDTLNVVNDKIQRSIDSYGYRIKKGLDLNYDRKFMYNVFRICYELEDLHEYGLIHLPIKNHDYLMKIKHGEIDRNILGQDLENEIKKLKILECNSVLKEQKFHDINNTMIQVIKEYHLNKNIN